ncbi:MAG: RHS repeat-associated core domain-containing protein [Planctomycetota bacterium]
MAVGRRCGDPALDGLAGVGGLLAVHQAETGGGAGGGGLDAGDYLYFHDTSGNVGQLVAWATGYGGAQADEWHVDRLVARYEYDPYGRIVGPDTNADGKFDAQDDPGFYAAANPFRWSTKRFDPETGSPQRISPQAGLSDFGMRYYSATLGRWLNRDPIGDFATANLVRHSESRRRRTFSGLGGANVYAYVGNNPTNFTDYLGLASASCRPGEPCHSGLSSGGGGGGDPWSPEPTTVEEGDRRPCPHAGRGRPGDDGTNLYTLPPFDWEKFRAWLDKLRAQMEAAAREERERRQLLIYLHGYEGKWFDQDDLFRLWFEAYKALINSRNARFREMFRQFVDAWAAAYAQALASDPYSFSSTWIHGVAREGWRLVHDDETLAGMSDTRVVVEAGAVSVVLGTTIYVSGRYVIVWVARASRDGMPREPEPYPLGPPDEFRGPDGGSYPLIFPDEPLPPEDDWWRNN